MKISHLSFGASSLGSVFRETKEKESFEAVEAAIEGGINFIDVSPYYGHYKAETVLGKALRNIPRDRYFLSTKVGRYGKDGKNTWDYSAQRVTDSVYESMERLGIGSGHLHLAHAGVQHQVCLQPCVASIGQHLCAATGVSGGSNLCGV